jgi:ADP-ribosyl-[dinitrogen reductase] hydrolase
MLAGAYYGMEGIPRRWYKKLDQRVLAEIEFLAMKIVEASPLMRVM